MKIFKISLSIVLLSVISFYGCKKDEKDGQAPNITVFSPSAGSYYDVLDTLSVKAKITDNNSVRSISVGLLYDNFITAQSFVSVSPTGATTNIDIKYVLEDFHLPTGDYYLSISASDGENIKKSNTLIHLTASPTIKTGYLVLSDNINTVDILKLDTGFNAGTSFIHQGTFISSEISNYYQRIFVSGSTTKDFLCYDISTGAAKWQLDNFGGLQPYFTNTHGDGKNVYVGTYDGSITKYNYLGNNYTNYSYTDPFYSPEFFYLHSNYGLSQYYYPAGFTRKLIVHQTTNGLSIQEYPINFNIIFMHERNLNEVFVIGNDLSNQGVIRTYNISQNGFYTPLNLPTGKVLSATAIDNDNILIAHADGNIYKFTYSNSNLVSIYSGIVASRIKYDPIQNELLASEVKQLRSFAVGAFSLTLKNTHLNTDTIEDFFVTYNK